MKKYLLLNGTLLLFACCGSSNEQGNNETKNTDNMETTTKTKTITIKKGQSIDFLVGVINPETDQLREEYFENIMPTAQQNGFKSEMQLLVSAPTVKGEFNAMFGGLMSWPDSEGRSGFREKMKNHSYDYLKQRKKIWPIFNLIEHDDIDSDYTFEVSDDKIYVITLYWISDIELFKKNNKNTPANIENHGGKILISLKDGKDPNNNYQPNYISITEWNSIDSFNIYIATEEKAAISEINKTNQWITSVLLQ